VGYRGVAQLGLARLLGVQEVAGSNPAVPISWPMAKKECIVPLWRAGVVSIQPRTWLSEVADVPESGSIRKSNYQEVYDTPESRRCNDEIVDKPKLDPVELAWGSMPVHRQSAKRDAPSSPADLEIDSITSTHFAESYNLTLELLFRDLLNQRLGHATEKLIPDLECRLAEQSHRGIPGGVIAIELPAPVANPG
jgi:hypothetical protein